MSKTQYGKHDEKAGVKYVALRLFPVETVAKVSNPSIGLMPSSNAYSIFSNISTPLY